MSGLSLLDRLTLAYVAFAALVTACRWPTASGAPLPLLVYASVAALALAGPSLRRHGGFTELLGEVYPLVLTVVLYGAIGTLNAASGVLHDGRIQAWEQTIFGGQPSMAWIRAVPSPAFSTLMHAAYLSYYLILTTGPLALWYSGRRNEARRTVLACMATFFACYGVFLLFPVAGPRYVFPLATNDATAIGIARFTQRLLEGGSAIGTAFPSSHVAASAALSVQTFLGWPRLGAPLVAASVLLTLATVYCQFHYATDALAGAVLAAAVLALSQTLFARTRDASLR